MLMLELAESCCFLFRGGCFGVISSKEDCSPSIPILHMLCCTEQGSRRAQLEWPVCIGILCVRHYFLLCLSVKHQAVFHH